MLFIQIVVQQLEIGQYSVTITLGCRRRGRGNMTFILRRPCLYFVYIIYIKNVPALLRYVAH